MTPTPSMINAENTFVVGTTDGTGIIVVKNPRCDNADHGVWDDNRNRSEELIVVVVQGSRKSQVIIRIRYSAERHRLKMDERDRRNRGRSLAQN